jgi:hypothetical protein
MLLDIWGFHLADQPQQGQRLGLKVQRRLNERLPAVRTIRKHGGHAVSLLREVTVDAPCPVTRAIVRIVDDAIDHGSHVVSNEYDKAVRRQFIITQVNLAALADLYGRNPRKPSSTV